MGYVHVLEKTTRTALGSGCRTLLARTFSLLSLRPVLRLHYLPPRGLADLEMCLDDWTAIASLVIYCLVTAEFEILNY